MEHTHVRGMTARFRVGTALTAVAAMTSTGCYAYFPVDREAIQPGDQVRVVLTATGSERIPPMPGRAHQLLDGDVVAMSPDTTALSVWIGQAYRGSSFYSAHSRFAFPAQEIVGYQRRDFSRWRTAVAAAGAVAGVVAVITTVDFIEDANSPDEEGPIVPPVEESRVSFNLLTALRFLTGR